MRRTETPKPIWIKFCMVVDIPDIVNYTKFGDHRLRGFWVAVGQIFLSPIDFHCRPYNTLALTDCTAALFLFSNRHIVKLVAWHSGSKYGKKLYLYLYIVNV